MSLLLEGWRRRQLCSDIRWTGQQLGITTNRAGLACWTSRSDREGGLNLRGNVQGVTAEPFLEPFHEEGISAADHALPSARRAVDHAANALARLAGADTSQVAMEGRGGADGAAGGSLDGESDAGSKDCCHLRKSPQL